MHWAYKIANELINKYPNKNTFVCASGISPSGSVHIGNFREIVTTHFVVKALQDLGKKTRFIFSWDDYDRFRKVPKNVNPSFEKYIGLPYSDIPDPFGCHASYAEHFEKEFEKSLAAFGIEVEFLYQSKEYRAGRYNRHILHALQSVLSKTDEEYTVTDVKKISDRVEYWIKNWHPQKMICINDKKDIEYYEALDEIQKKWLKEFCDILRNNRQIDQLMEKIYAICHDEDKKIMRANQKLLFNMVYKFVLNSSAGPRLPLLIQAVGIERMVSLLDF